MSKQFYIQVRSTDNVITDCIEYAYGDYIPVTLDLPLPEGIIGGWYKYENGVVVEHPELKPASPTDAITELQSNQAQIILALVNAGVM